MGCSSGWVTTWSKIWVVIGARILINIGANTWANTEANTETKKLSQYSVSENWEPQKKDSRRKWVLMRKGSLEQYLEEKVDQNIE